LADDPQKTIPVSNPQLTILGEMALHLREGLLIIDPQGMVCYTNPAAERLLGKSSGDLIGKNLDLPPLKAEPSEVELMLPDSQGVVMEMEQHELKWGGEAFQLVFLRRSAEPFRQISNLIKGFGYGVRITSQGKMVILWTTDSFEKTTGYTQNDIASMQGGWMQMVLLEDHERLHQSLKRMLSGQPDVIDFRFKTRDGTLRWLRHTGYPVLDEHQERVTRIYGTVQDIHELMLDITARKEAEETLRYRVALEEIVTTISTRFLTVPLPEVENELQRMLGIIGLFTGVDRSFVFLLSADGTCISNVYEWLEEGIEPSAGKFIGRKLDSFKWMLERLNSLQTLYFPNLDHIPEEAQFEKKFYQLTGLRSMLAIPLAVGDILTGWFGFATERSEKHWTADDLKLLRMVGEIIVNVLLRKQMDADMQQSEERYRAVVETQTEMILRWTIEGKVIFANEAFRRCFGEASEKLEIKSIQPHIHPDDFEVLLQKLSALGPHLTELTTEFRMLAPEGEIRWHHWNNRAILDQNGQLTEIQSVGRDITDLKRAERALQDSETRYRIVAQMVSDYAYVVRFGTQGEIQMEWVNGAFARTLGYDPVRLGINNEWLQLIHPEDRSLIEGVTAQLKVGQTVTHEMRVITGNEVRWLRVYNYPVRDELTGRLVRVYGAVQDISRNRKAEDDLRQSYQKLAQSVHILERHNREITLVGEMGDLLQSCLHFDEARQVFAQFAGQLFPDLSGALFLFDAERNMLETAAAWGHNLQTEREFIARDCWALRRGRLYMVETSSNVLLCNHVNPPASHSFTPYQCVPMMAQGEMLGMLYLENPSPGSTETLLNQTPLALMVAERLGMALSNIKLRETLRYQATRDALSGLLNRRVLEEMVEKELRDAALTQQTLAILMTDMDNFKRINDTYGYDAGDMLITQAGAMLQATCQPGETPFRFGGDQFALLVLGATPETAQQRALRLQTDIGSLRAAINGRPVGKITSCVGIAVYPQHADTRVALLHAAEQALFTAKANGSGSIAIAVEH
jgi:diguanylate cyclase (GGDEF)-like protein/PAS domain S-box-containing protein